jgi:hypothetical protein
MCSENLKMMCETVITTDEFEKLYFYFLLPKELKEPG